MIRYVYRTSDDIVPRATANAGHSTVRLGAMALPAYPIYPFRPTYGGPSAPVCPAWGCGPAPIRVVDGPANVNPGWDYANGPTSSPVNPWFGSTSTIPQPPPATPQPSASVTNPLAQPLAPQPSPTVAVPASQTAPSLTQPGTTLDSSGASTTVAPSGISAWLSEQTLISGFANWEVAGAGLVALFFMMRGKGRR